MHATHGDTRIGDALQVSSEALARLCMDPSLEGLDLRRALFLDTETTGLSQGTGTLPFLIGLGRFDDGGFEVEQLFLENVGEERPMLEHLKKRVSEASCIVTYNGKSFDWPLLRTRYVMNRVPMVPPKAHVDLLHAARRVYKRRLKRVRLVSLEEEVLGFHRVGDVPGSEIPALYFEYLRGGEPGPMRGVLEHNAHDIVALCAVLKKLVEGYEVLRKAEDGRDRLGYAEVAARMGDEVRASSFAVAAARRTSEPSCAIEALLLAARLARRRGEREAEESALREAGERVNRGGCEDTLAAAVWLALAKFHEHRARDFRAALACAQDAELAEGIEASRRRVARLRRRIAKQMDQPPEIPSSAAAVGGVLSSKSSR